MLKCIDLKNLQPGRVADHFQAMQIGNFVCCCFYLLCPAMSANFNSILLIVTYLDQANDAHDQEAGVRDLAGFSHCLRSVSHRLRQTFHFSVVGFCLETSFVILRGSRCLSRCPRPVLVSDLSRKWPRSAQLCEDFIIADSGWGNLGMCFAHAVVLDTLPERNTLSETKIALHRPLWISQVFTAVCPSNRQLHQCCQASWVFLECLAFLSFFKVR